jgi:hypothetical protein
LPSDVDLAAVGVESRKVRVQGLVVARGSANALVVLARDGAVAGLAIAQSLGGTLRTASLDELRGRSYEAV